ncbi:MAG: flavodoxin [Fusobacterium gastrosuis]|uniref:flavodoxin n=1 Tax=Fusobacterium TaxID=848 RepID=UPI001F4FBA39|nr:MULTISPECIES: flavodoxin [Fusobacterium]MDD7410118.1 flavodoxin [Fusobacteriaceae bacterium]MCI5725500.1 flavodoxin [Fusobacterium sp.]MCI7224496.1 flavodoxin [Fusobacterium sp.]MDY4010801.1 flavodoxin [Fusobacterium gastrosuis]MDY5306413.1 flavodoxin [Fusobacterium gastrosuis]
MNKISVVYYSSTGFTQAMAEALVEGVKSAGIEPNVYKISEVNVDDVFSSDVIAMGSSACGAETIEETYFVPFMDENLDKFNGKKVYIFGSYGWGGGEYADNWKAQLEGAGANVVAMPILVNDGASDEELEQLKEIGKKLATI